MGGDNRFFPQVKIRNLNIYFFLDIGSFKHLIHVSFYMNSYYICGPHDIDLFFWDLNLELIVSKLKKLNIHLPLFYWVFKASNPSIFYAIGVGLQDIDLNLESILFLIGLFFVFGL